MPREGYYLPGRRLVSQDDAALVEPANVPRSKFIGAKTRKTSFNAGWLIPFFLDEIYPGDHMTYDVTAYVRIATPLFPLLDQQRIDTFWFFVPHRLVWDNWQAFMGEVEPDGDPLDYLVPIYDFTGYGAMQNGGLLDHLGISPARNSGSAENTQEVSCLPERGYRLIWNEWFRDQNIIDRLPIDKGDGPDDPVDDFDENVSTGEANNFYGLKKRAKSHDYFTSALPWPQKFTPAPIPLAGNAPVLGIARDLAATPTAGPLTVVETQTPGIGAATTVYAQGYQLRTEEEMYVRAASGDAGVTYVPQIYADLSEATGVAINTFRQAFMLNQLLERDARGGTRYVELLRSHFGVISPDFRLQRPEYIGGGQTPLTITPVAQTAPDDTEGTTVGALGGAGAAAGQHRASYAATEHGYIMALINVRSELSYQAGLHKTFSRRTRYDFYFPSFAGLGEQAILRRELFWDPAETATQQEADIFGYQERWHELRAMQSDLSGAMRSKTGADSLDTWHLAQWFDTITPGITVALNQEFIQDTPPMERVLAHGDTPGVPQDYLADILIRRTAIRALPTYGTPAILGRF